MTAPQTILLEDTPTASETLLTLLQAHLPHSITVLRQIQFARNFPGGSTPNTHILYAHYGQPATASGASQSPTTTNTPFAAALVDLSRGPETQLTLYSSLELAANESHNNSTKDIEPSHYTWTTTTAAAARPPQDEAALDLVLALFRRTRALALAATTTTTTDREKDNMVPLVGSLHETVRQGLLARGVGVAKSAAVPPGREWEFCGKWLFRVEELPLREGWALPEGVRWDEVRREDVVVVQARTRVRRLA